MIIGLITQQLGIHIFSEAERIESYNNQKPQKLT